MATAQENRTLIMIHRPSLREKLFFFISGIVISVPFTLFVGRLTESLCISLSMFYAELCSIAIFTPFVEEFAKAYPLFYRHGETEKAIFTLGFLVGLGFGISEFILYIYVLEAPILARLPLMFFHAASTSITAYGVATKRTARFYLTAVILHFANNFFAMFEELWLIGGATAIAIAYVLSWRLYRKATERMID